MVSRYGISGCYIPRKARRVCLALLNGPRLALASTHLPLQSAGSKRTLRPRRRGGGFWHLRGMDKRRLAKAGSKVALLEGGKPQSDGNFTEHQPLSNSSISTVPAKSCARRDRSSRTSFGANTAPIGSSISKRPTPSLPFLWMGGSPAVTPAFWGWVCLGCTDCDFEAASHDGYGEDSCLVTRDGKDLEPYYEFVEKMRGISGSEEGHDYETLQEGLPSKKSSRSDR